MRKIMLFCLILTMGFGLVSCQNQKWNIPSGYVGKVLTPSGYQTGILEAGQVDLGEKDADGTANNLVLLEATSVTVKEQFNKTGNDEDHRISLRGKDGTKYMTCDIYVQLSLPKEEKLRENAFVCVTATPNGTDGRVSTIKLEDIYDQFAQMNVRGKSREVFTPYKSIDDVLANMDKLNAEIGKIVSEVITSSGAPVQLMSVQLSNVKEDQTIVASKNKEEASEAEVNIINKVGAAINSNPKYVEYYKWQVISEIMKVNPKAVLILDASGKANIQVPVK